MGREGLLFGMVAVINGVVSESQPTSVFIRVAEPTHSLTAHGCFYATGAELSSRERNIGASKAGNSYCLALSGP